MGATGTCPASTPSTSTTKGMAAPWRASRFCSRTYAAKGRRVSRLPAGRVAFHGVSRASSTRRSAYQACSSVRRTARSLTVSGPRASPLSVTAETVSVAGQAKRRRRRDRARAPAASGPRERSTAQASSSRQCSASPATTVRVASGTTASALARARPSRLVVPGRDVGAAA